MIRRSTDSVITELHVPSNRRRGRGEIELRGMEWLYTMFLSIKQCDEPQSISAEKIDDEKPEIRSPIERDIGSESAAALRRTSLGARLGSTQLPARARY